MRVTLLFLLACGRPPEPEAPRAVIVAPVTISSTLKDTRLHGVTEARSEARLSFTGGGRLEAIEVEIGQTVEEGHVLARLGARAQSNLQAGSSAQLSELRVRHDQLKRDLDRATPLRQSGDITTAEYERLVAAEEAARSSLRAASAQVSEASRQLDETVLRAPFHGTVVDLYVDAGETVDAGTPIVALAGTGETQVRVDVPESLILHIHTGTPATLDLPLVGITDLPTRVAQVGRAAAGRGQLFPVIVTLPDRDGITPGMTAEVTFRTPSAPQMAVPLSAIVSPTGSQSKVCVVRDGSVHLVALESAALDDDLVAVSASDLRLEDQVVVEGCAGLVDGDLVTVATRVPQPIVVVGAAVPP